MTTNSKLTVRWPLLAGCLGLILSIMACTVLSRPATSGTEDAALRLKADLVQGQDQNGDWQTVAVKSTFDMTGTLESTDPWKVAGTTLETRESTEIAEGLKDGDLVRVKGIILEDGTWVAFSIQPAETQAQPTIVLIGKVTSVDPWVVNGIKLNVTTDTVITGDIKPGMMVRVEILLSEDGTWEVLSIAPLGDLPETSGCVTVLATIVSVNGNEVQFLGWPSTVTLNQDVQVGNGNENEQVQDETTLAPGQTVLVVLCSVNGQIVITQITIVSREDGEAEAPGEGEKVVICHKPDKNGGHTLSVGAPAVPAHLAHGDTLGPCP